MLLPDDNRRALNDDRRRVFGESRAIAFLCECADPACRAAVVLTPRQYDAVLAAGDVLLHEGHTAATDAPQDASKLKSR